MSKAIEIKEKTTAAGNVYGYALVYVESRLCLDVNIRTLRGAKARCTYWARLLGLTKAADGMSAA